MKLEKREKPFAEVECSACQELERETRLKALREKWEKKLEERNVSIHNIPQALAYKYYLEIVDFFSGDLNFFEKFYILKKPLKFVEELFRKNLIKAGIAINECSFAFGFVPITILPITPSEHAEFFLEACLSQVCKNQDSRAR